MGNEKDEVSKIGDKEGSMLAHTFFYLMASQVISRAFSFVLNLLIARQLTEEDFAAIGSIPLESPCAHTRDRLGVRDPMPDVGSISNAEFIFCSASETLEMDGLGEPVDFNAAVYVLQKNERSHMRAHDNLSGIFKNDIGLKEGCL
eukprot:Gb_40504 [translate_table: standard]